MVFEKLQRNQIPYISSPQTHKNTLKQVYFYRFNQLFTSNVAQKNCLMGETVLIATEYSMIQTCNTPDDTKRPQFPFQFSRDINHGPLETINLTFLKH